MTGLSRQQFFGLWLGLAAVTVAGAWLRFRGLGLESISVDEAASWIQSKDSIADLLQRTARDNYPPLHNLLLYGSMGLFGDSEWALRLPSAILGIANVLLLYWLGTMTVGRTAGLLAAAFLALSTFHVGYSQEARMYALLAFGATLFAASSFYFIKAPSIARGALMGLSGVILLYSHPFGALNWIAIAAAFGTCFLLNRKSEWRTVVIWAVSNATALISFLPWAVILADRATAIQSQGFWIPSPTADYVLYGLVGVAGGWATALVLSIGMMLAVLPFRRSKGIEEPNTPLASIWVLMVWAFLPIALGLLASIVSTPIFLGRYLIGALPAVSLVAAYGLTRFATKRLWRAIVVALSLTVFAVSYAGDDYSEDDWRMVGSILTRQLEPSDCVVIYRNFPKRAVKYYYRKRIDCLLTPRRLRHLDIGGIDANRVFVIASRSSRSERLALFSAFTSEGWSLLQGYEPHNISVRVFAKPDKAG